MVYQENIEPIQPSIFQNFLKFTTLAGVTTADKLGKPMRVQYNSIGLCKSFFIAALNIRPETVFLIQG
jgi:hypothetical protein